MSTEEFNEGFEEARQHLKSYLLRLTAHVEDTEDIVQDTYLRAIDALPRFKGESSLKTWLFAIASNLARDNLRSKKRWVENVTDVAKEAALQNPVFFREAMSIRHSSAQGNFEIREHIAFCFTCISKSLPLEQHIAILLKEVYDFRVNEISAIMDTTEAMVKYYLHSGRTKMIRIFDGRCALINKEGTCHQCTELNGIFNPHQLAAEETAKIEMVRAAGSEDKEHLFGLRMDILRGIDPFESGASELQLHHLQHNRTVMEEYLKKNRP